MQPKRIVVRNNPNFDRIKENVFKYKIVTTPNFNLLDEDFILVKNVNDCKISLGTSFENGKKISIKSLTNTIIKPQFGLIDEEWEDLQLEQGASVQFIFIENNWYILSSDGLKMS